MGRPRIADVNFYDLKANMKRASDAKGLINPADKEKWKSYIKEHEVKEATCMSFGRKKSDSVKPVIINTGGDWDGFYVYSNADEVALKWIPAS